MSLDNSASLSLHGLKGVSFTSVLSRLGEKGGGDSDEGSDRGWSTSIDCSTEAKLARRSIRTLKSFSSCCFRLMNE